MSNLPPVGVEATAKNLPAFDRAMAAMNATVNKAAQGLQKATEKTTAADKASKSAQKSISVFTEAMKKLGEMSGGTTGSIATMISQFLSLTGVSGAAAAAVAAAGAAIFTLGLRGGTVKGITEAFTNLAQVTGQTADVFLDRLRLASKGTITDFELMRQANVALAGASGVVAQELGAKLPKLLEIARVQARATGQSVDHLFESLVLGVKRGSPLLIDNTGLVLKVGEANEQYAKSIGKTVEQLTAQEQQIAILNATLAAGDLAIQSMGNQQELSTEKFAKFQALVGNMIDQLAVMFEPVTAGILDIVNTIVGFIGTIVTTVTSIFGPIIQAVMNFIGIFTGAFSGIVGIVSNVVSAIGGIVGNIVETLVVPFELAVEAIGAIFGGVISVIGGVITSILDGLAQGANLIIGLARLFFVGGARVIGALAGGIASAATKYVLPAVKAIAKLIADFLVGLSPPPEGPLSKIDKGGENVMKAWLDGFLGAGLKPVQQVAAEVTQLMGDIGSASRDQVTKRLAALDAAIQPFADKLAIVKAQFDALKEPAEAAFRAIDRQIETAVQALAKGEAGSGELVRQLDAQRESLESMMEARQSQIDQAQIQLSLAKATQAQERTLLEIRQRQLGQVEKITQAITGGGSEAAKKAGGGGGGGSGGGGAPKMDLGSAGGGGSGFGDQVRGSLAEGFSQGIGGIEGVTEFQNQVAGVQSEIARINSVDIGSKLSEKLGSIFDPNKEGSVIYNIKTWFQNTFDPSHPDSIFKWFQNLPANIMTAAGDLSTSVDAAIIQPLRLAILSFGVWLTDASDPTSLPGSIAFAISQIPTVAASIAQAIDTSIVTPVRDKLTEVGAFVHNLFAGTGEGSIKWMLDKAVEWFAALPANIGSALASMGTWFVETFVYPIIMGINDVISAFEGFINNSILPGIREIGAHILTIMSLAGQAGSDSYNALFSALQNANVSFGRIAVPGAARGGAFTEGLMKVGERGTEYIASASKTAVFPHQFVRSIESLTSMISQAAPMVVPDRSGATNNNYNNGINATFNNIQNPQDAMRRLSIMRAMR